VPLSLLDRARARAGEDDAAALTGVVARARRADDRGLRRVLVAEHHAVPGVVGSAPAVLMAAVLAATRHVRVGSAGVMLPHHQPLVVAEQAATLEALHPGRVDLGLGRSPGFTAPVRAALGRHGTAPDRTGDEEVEEDLRELLALLRGEAPVTLRPAVPAPPVLLLATGGGLRLAARLGLPVVVGGPLVTALAAADDGTDAAARARAALEGYRAGFVAAPDGPAAPEVLVAVDVLAAPTAEEAAALALPEAWAHVDARTTGSFPPLAPLAEVEGRTPTGAQERHLAAALAGVVAGTPAHVEEVLARLVARTGASELVLTASTTDRASLDRSDAAVAALSAPAVAAAGARALSPR